MRSGVSGLVEHKDGAFPYLTIAIVCQAHFMSHCFALLLPPIFLFMAPYFGVGFTELGIALTVFSVATTLSQPIVGRMVDRFGAREILIAGLVLEGTSFVVIGLTQSYFGLLLLMGAAGLANSAYHPADYAILGRLIPRDKIGKVFSLHTFSGFLGSALAPMAMIFAATVWSWQAGVITVGLVGIASSFLIPLIPRLPAPPGADSAQPKSSKRPGLSAPVVSLTVFFFMVALSTSGIQNFAVVALSTDWGVSSTQASTTLTVFLAAMAFGVLAGGFLADRFKNHETIAAICFFLAGLATLLIVVGSPSFAAITVILGMAGFLVGVVMPSRDMMVHKAAAPGTEGYVFGVVTTGLNAGGIVAPPIFGFLIDNGLHAGIFILSASAMLLTGTLAVLQQRTGRRMVSRDVRE